jgi:hypothetical protein
MFKPLPPGFLPHFIRSNKILKVGRPEAAPQAIGPPEVWNTRFSADSRTGEYDGPVTTGKQLPKLFYAIHQERSSKA